MTDLLYATFNVLSTRSGDNISNKLISLMGTSDPTGFYFSAHAITSSSKYVLIGMNNTKKELEANSALSSISSSIKRKYKEDDVNIVSVISWHNKNFDIRYFSMMLDIAKMWLDNEDVDPHIQDIKFFKNSLGNNLHIAYLNTIV